MTAHEPLVFSQTNVFQDVEAVEVYWAPVGIGAQFFHRTYWFRKSDGVFIKQEGSNDKARELIKEN